ncbi:MAG: NUDIX domain-containing protein [Vicinamibacterales bacterium]
MPERPLTLVAVGILQRADGQVLFAQRPAGKAYAGYWEFPGGKIEPGESAHAALARELDEELRVRVTAATPWITQRHVYPHAHVELRFFRVTAWDGDIHPQEEQQVAWQVPGDYTVAPMLPALLSADCRVLSGLLEEARREQRTPVRAQAQGE